MVKSLPYLPSKASMSIKRRISLRPRFQTPLTKVMCCKNNGNNTSSGVCKTTSVLCTPPSDYLPDAYNHSIEDAASTSGIFEASNCENEPNSRHRGQKQLHIDKFIHFLDCCKPLPYLPSCEASSADVLLSSRCDTLEPRPTSNQFMKFLR